MFQRFRRLRKNERLRNMVADVSFSVDHLVMPYFVKDGTAIKSPISSMEGQFHFSMDCLIEEIKEITALGISSILLFGIPAHKDRDGSEAWNPQGIIPRTIKTLKKHFPELFIIADVCLCEYTSTGHCGVCIEDRIDNDLTLPLLIKTALAYAEAGADMIAPSDMMDGRIGAIRLSLDSAGYGEVPIMAYSSKYSSAYYGPFREAAGSMPQFGNRKSYQMDFRRKKEALAKAQADLSEGADIIMVKPGLAYLDILHNLSLHLYCPLAVYNVSGEYSMVKAAARQGLINEQEIIYENMAAFRRAGANIIITYHAKDIAVWRLR